MIQVKNDFFSFSFFCVSLKHRKITFLKKKTEGNDSKASSKNYSSFFQISLSSRLFLTNVISIKKTRKREKEKKKKKTQTLNQVIYFFLMFCSFNLTNIEPFFFFLEKKLEKKKQKTTAGKKQSKAPFQSKYSFRFFLFFF